MKQLQIMYADDDPDDITIFKSLLNDLGFPVDFVSFNSGAKLLAILKNAVALPDLILLDINMPRMSGFDCLRAIKKIDRLAAIPVIILSTSSAQYSIDVAKELGAADYISKPASYQSYKDEISSLLQRIL